MPFFAILLVFKFLMFSFLQVCRFTDLQVHTSIDCPYFYGLSVKVSDLLHLYSIPIEPVPDRRPSVHHFQRSSSLKPLGQSKPNFMWSLLGKGEQKFI